MGQEVKIQLFDTSKIRVVWDDEAEKYYFSVVDVVGALTESADYQLARNYWKVLKHRLIKEGNETVTNCNQLKLPAPDAKLQAVAPEMFIHDPVVLEFLNLKDYPALHESTLEQALIDNLQTFLLELGKGFCFVARQKRMRYEDEDFYLDLVFYHSILKCHVLIDLKIGKLTHGDVGQMDSYIRMFDALYKNDDDNPTIGLILCSQKNEAIVRYSVLNDAKQIFASRYMLYLPTERELQQELEREQRRINILDTASPKS